MYTSEKRKQQLPPTTQHHQVEQFFFVSFETSQFLFDENANKTQAIQEHHGEERKRERESVANKQANSKASLTNTCKRRENKSEEERETKPTVTANFADVIVLMFLKLIFIIF